MASATEPQRASERRTVERITASTSSLLLVAILVMANYLAFRHYQRFDWTTQSLFTLSARSKAVLKDLDKDIDIYLFLSRGESGFLATDELLKRYPAASPHIHLHYVDPDREPSQFKLLAQRFGVAAGVLESGDARADVAAVVARGDKNWHIDREDLVASTAPTSDGETEVQMKGEQALTGAIVQVISGRATKLCATAGHGEWTLEEAQERSLAPLKRDLRHENLEWQSFETLGQKSVPSGCDAVLVVGPLHAFSEPEAKLLVDYARTGGNLLLALDPVLEHDAINPTGFEGPLRDLGIRVDPTLVVELDADHLLTRSAAEFVVTEFGDHVSTRPLQHVARVFMSIARSVTPISQDGSVEILLRASEKSFAKTNVADLKVDAEPARGAADIEGPVSLGVASQLKAADPKNEKARGGRVIVLGDSDFLQGPLLEAPELQNLQFASGMLGWLAERPALIEIPPKKIKSGNIVFSQEDLWALLFRVVVLLPAAALTLGVAVWLNRRN